MQSDFAADIGRRADEIKGRPHKAGSLHTLPKDLEGLANVCSNNKTVHLVNCQSLMVQELIQSGARCLVSLVYEDIVQEAYHY